MSDTFPYPKVLVVCCNPFSRERSNGMTMSNLFEGWPKDRLAQIFVVTITTIPPAYDVCERYWKISPVSCLMSLAGIRRNGALTQREGTDLAEAHQKAPWWYRCLMYLNRRTRIGVFAEPIRELLFTPSVLITRQLQLWIESFKPDVIYTMLGSLHMINLVMSISKEYSIPVVPHFTDDWPVTAYSGCVGGRWLLKRTQQSLARLLARSPVRLTIGDEMAEEYSRRYGGDFLAFMNCVDANLFRSAIERSPEHSVIKLVYMGGLLLNRWRSLSLIGTCLEGLRAEGINAELLIYTSPESIRSFRTLLDRPPVMRLAGWVKNSDVPRIIEASDIMIHVESFDKSITKYTRFSMSTKIPECLMAGRCILAFGPMELASMRYIYDARVGLTVGEQDPDLLRDGLRRYLRNSDLRQDCGRRAREVALQRHEAFGQRDRFRKAIATSLRKNVETRLSS